MHSYYDIINFIFQKELEWIFDIIGFINVYIDNCNNITYFAL